MDIINQFATHQYRVEKRMKEYPQHQYNDVTEVIDQLNVCDYFDGTLLQGSVVSNQTHNVNPLQYHRHRAEHNQRRGRSNREDKPKNYRRDQRPYTRFTGKR